jgi:hypothetical protein
MNNDQHSSTNRIPLTENADYIFGTCPPTLSMCSTVGTVATSGRSNAGSLSGMLYQNNISYSGTEMNFTPDANERSRTTMRNTLKTVGYRQFQRLLRLVEAASYDAGVSSSPAAVSVWSATTSAAAQSADILSEKSMAVLERIATDHRTPGDVLDRLAQHPNPDLRSSLSDNKSTPSATIWALAKDADPNVRYQLAENPHLPIELLMALRDDDHPYVACRAERTISRLQVGW